MKKKTVMHLRTTLMQQQSLSVLITRCLVEIVKLQPAVESRTPATDALQGVIDLLGRQYETLDETLKSLADEGDDAA
jgi:hypothetical protein